MEAEYLCIGCSTGRVEFQRSFVEQDRKDGSWYIAWEYKCPECGDTIQAYATSLSVLKGE